MTTHRYNVTDTAVFAGLAARQAAYLEELRQRFATYGLSPSQLGHMLRLEALERKDARR